VETIENGTPVKEFDEMPTLSKFPSDYPVEMPRFLAKMAQEHGPIFRRAIAPEFHHIFGKWLVFMIGPEANKFVMHTHRQQFSHDKGWTPTISNAFGKGLLNTDDPEHARQRKMMNPAFAVAYMNKYLPIMNRIIAKRTAGWVNEKSVDVYQEARKITFDVAAEALTGIKTGTEVDRLRELFYTIMFSQYNSSMETEEQFWQRLSKTRRELDNILLRMIAERRNEPSDDILDILVQATDDQGVVFTDEELVGQLHILLVAGHETTTTMVTWALYLLSIHPEQLAKVRTEIDEVLAQHNGAINLEATRAMKLLGYAIEEAGRLHPPAGNVPRGVVEDFEFGGYKVPAGTRVALSLAATHRLPDIFQDPDKYDPDRFAPPREEDKKTPYSLVTFGGGPRVCIGMNFALVEMKAMAAYLLSRYDLEPVEGEEFMHAYYSPVATIFGGVNMRVKPRSK
jgi:cytochrome P450